MYQTWFNVLFLLSTNNRPVFYPVAVPKMRLAVPKAEHPGEAIADRPLLVMISACRSLEHTKNRNTLYLARANLARAVTQESKRSSHNRGRQKAKVSSN
jgi:hypothetical protein